MKPDFLKLVELEEQVEEIDRQLVQHNQKIEIQKEALNTLRAIARRQKC